MPGGARICALAVVAAAVVGGCGSDDGTIPSENGDVLLKRLDEIQGAVAGGNCVGAQESAALFTTQVSQLSADEVDAEVKEALTRGAERLNELVNDPTQCAPTETTVPTEPPEEETTEPPEEETTEPPEEETTEPPEGETTDEEEETDQNGGGGPDGGQQGSGQDGGDTGGGEDGGGPGGGDTGGLGGGAG